MTKTKNKKRYVEKGSYDNKDLKNKRVCTEQSEEAKKKQSKTNVLYRFSSSSSFFILFLDFCIFSYQYVCMIRERGVILRKSPVVCSSEEPAEQKAKPRGGLGYQRYGPCFRTRYTSLKYYCVDINCVVVAHLNPSLCDDFVLYVVANFSQ